MSKIRNISVHFVGNKTTDEILKISLNQLDISEKIGDILNLYFSNSFKSSEYFTFYHDIDINMNEVFVCANKIFDNPETLLEQSQNL
ncbi:MAG: nucleoid-associated protein, partial [Bacteroidales bacterium]|nr:nucleoid-associated protein [Bacteroidales bacterium]